MGTLLEYHTFLHCVEGYAEKQGIFEGWKGNDFHGDQKFLNLFKMH